jgi:hypothetical protein
LSDDDIAKAVSIALLVTYLGAAVWRRQWVAPLNLIVAAGVTVFWTFNISELSGSVAAVWVFAGVEVVILAVSALAVLGYRVPAAAVWLGFAVHVVLTALFALFMFTFRMERMM